MTGHHAEPARRLLPPVTAGDRPLWSVMIPTYNCARYLRETLTSVLAQDPGPDEMQIEVVDDASDKDDPAAVVAELGEGRIGFFRQPANVGHTMNFATCLERSRGRLIHLLHGDDLVRDGFYRKLQYGFEVCPTAGAAYCRHVYIDETGQEVYTPELERTESGVLEGWLERIAVRQLIQTPSIAVRREVYETLGLFDRRLTWCEDWEMWCRIAAHYPVWYEREVLAVYRLHASSSTSRKIQSGESLRDIRRAIDIINRYLPAEIAGRIRRESLDYWAEDSLRYRVPRLLQNSDWRGAANQTVEALRCSRSARSLGWAARLAPCVARAMVLDAGRALGRQTQSHIPSR